MPNCFQLFRNGQSPHNGEPVALSQVDEEICAHFNEPCHPVRYFRVWYDTIGYDLAAGQSWEQIRAKYTSPEWAESGLLPVAEWLSANFTPRSWYELRSHPRSPGNSGPGELDGPDGEPSFIAELPEPEA